MAVNERGLYDPFLYIKSPHTVRWYFKKTWQNKSVLISYANFATF